MRARDATPSHQTARDDKRCQTRAGDERRHLPDQARCVPAGAVGDNVAEGLEYAAGGDWEPAASAPDANGLGDAHVDVSQIAENLRISRPSAYRLIEGEQIPAIRIGRLQACSEGRARREAAPHEQRRLVKARHELAALGSGQAPRWKTNRV